MGKPATDYTLTSQQADTLKAVVLMPAEIRAELLGRYLAEHGADALLGLFVQAVGMANSVVANNRAMLEVWASEALEMTPGAAQRLNLPTLFGALGGVELAAAAGACKGMCPTCAYRHGSPANQCEPTVADADWQAANGDPFMCHNHAPHKPMRPCRGHARRMKGEAPHG